MRFNSTSIDAGGIAPHGPFYKKKEGKIINHIELGYINILVFIILQSIYRKLSLRYYTNYPFKNY